MWLGVFLIQTAANLCLRYFLSVVLEDKHYVYIFHSHLHFLGQILVSNTIDVNHYDDVIMTMLESQITSLTVVYSIVYSGVHQRKHQSSASLAFPAQMASYAENASIWWRHHAKRTQQNNNKKQLTNSTLYFVFRLFNLEIFLIELAL